MRVLVRLVLALSVLTAGWVGAPTASACACGAVEPRNDKTLRATGEQAVVVFDGRRQSTAISMNLTGDGADVAFLLPVPATAELDLAPDDLFAELYEHTRPVVRTEYRYLPTLMAGAGAEAAPGSGVDVTRRERIGDYDVVEIGGNPEAVGRWLDGNGFRTRAEVLAPLGTYLDDGWRVLAVRLVLDAAPDGPSQPLVASFDTDRAVYPMRLGAAAETTQDLRLYVLAEHRMVADLAGSGELDVVYAGESTPALDAVGTLPGPGVLTVFDAGISPSNIEGDVLLSVDPAGDAPYRDSVVQYVDRSDVTLAVGLGVVLVAQLAALAWGLLTLRRLRR